MEKEAASSGYGQNKQGADYVGEDGPLRDNSPLVPTSERGQVLVQYSDLGNALQCLGELLVDLRRKLEPILGLSYPTPSNSEETAKPAEISPLATSLRGDVRKVRDLHVEVLELTTRIEL